MTRIGFIGPYSCGKTTLINKLCTVSLFDWDADTPLLAATYSPEVHIVKTGRTEMVLIDTAGQERFRSLSTVFLRGCDVIVSCQEAEHYTRGEKEYMGIHSDDVQGVLDMCGDYQLLEVLTKSDLCDAKLIEPLCDDFVVTSAFDRDSVIYLLKVLEEASSISDAVRGPRPDSARLESHPNKSCC